MIFGSVPTKFRFGSCGSFSFTGSMTPRFVPVRVCRFVSVRGHTVYIYLSICIWAYYIIIRGDHLLCLRAETICIYKLFFCDWTQHKVDICAYFLGCFWHMHCLSKIRVIDIDGPNCARGCTLDSNGPFPMCRPGEWESEGIPLGWCHAKRWHEPHQCRGAIWIDFGLQKAKKWQIMVLHFRPPFSIHFLPTFETLSDLLLAQHVLLTHLWCTPFEVSGPLA